MGSKKAETRIDLLQCLGTDISICIMSFIDDPADLVRLSSVSRFWHQLVIANGLAKKLFLKKFPQLFSVVGVVNANEETTNSVEVETKNAMDWETLERDHKLYASLLHAITKSKIYPMDCVVNAVTAFSTENYPDESVVNTLKLRKIFNGKASYWSSKWQRNPEVPEALIYKLGAGIWVVTEIDIQPFKAFFQEGKLRFSIGGYLQIELLGRVQRQEIDGLLYICVRFVRVKGCPLFPAFDMEILEPNGEICLKYYPENLKSVMRDYWRNEIPHLRHLQRQMMWDRINLLRRI